MIFIDSSALIAFRFPPDDFHEEAKQGMAELEASGEDLVTTLLCLGETFTFLKRYVSADYARIAGRAYLESDAYTVVEPNRDDNLGALDDLARFATRKVGYTDCSAFALMRRMGLTRAFAFDLHFDTKARVELWPLSPDEIRKKIPAERLKKLYDETAPPPPPGK